MRKMTTAIPLMTKRAIELDTNEAEGYLATTLTVTEARLVSIAVTPANPTIAAGQQQQFTATGAYTDGSQQNLTSTAVWTSNAPSVATVSAGLATAIAAGSTNIQATSGSISGSTTLTVIAQPIVSLAWTASTSQNVVGYNAYRSLTSGGPYTKLNASLIANTSYIDQTVQSGTTYYYVSTRSTHRAWKVFTLTKLSLRCHKPSRSCRLIQRRAGNNGLAGLRDKRIPIAV